MVHEVEPLVDGVWVLPLRTPTLPPATQTNTMIVGKRRLTVIEPATPFADQQQRLTSFLREQVAQGAEVAAILVTHHHPDHIGFAGALRELFDVPLLAHAETAARIAAPVDRQLSDDERLDGGDGFEIRPVFTPGHAPGHLVYLETSTGVAHGGDMVAGEGTILIDPDDDGDMLAYLDSLRRLCTLGIERLVPAHGPVLEEPNAVFERYIAHRLGREQKVVDAIGTEPIEFQQVLARAYADTPQALWPLAAKSLEAHLRKLEVEARVRRDGPRIEAVP